MSKKTWILITCLVLSLSLGLGGSLAYLTDTDTKVNTFTMGNVDIEVEENFPGDEENKVPIRPGIQITKEAKIWNTGDDDAFVWMSVAVPAKLDTMASGFNEDGTEWTTNKAVELIWPEEVNNGTYPTLGFQDGKPSFEEGDCINYYTVRLNENGERDENGEEYNVYTVVCWEPLAPGEATPNLLLAVSMNEFLDAKNVDTYDDDGNHTGQQMQWYEVQDGVERHIPSLDGYNGEAFNVFVSAYAIQAEGFNSFQDAYDAFNRQWGGVQQSTNAVQSVSNEDGLREAIENGGRIKLMKDIKLNSLINITNAGDITINLNGHTISRDPVEREDGKLDGCLFYINNENAHVRFEGWGTLVMRNGQAIWVNAGEAEIDGVGFGNDSDHHVYVTSKGKATILEGYFHPTNDGEFLLNKYDSDRATTEIEVRGGTFVRWNPADNRAEGLGTDFVGENCEVWKVTYLPNGEDDVEYIVLDATLDNIEERREQMMRDHGSSDWDVTEYTNP